MPYTGRVQQLRPTRHAYRLERWMRCHQGHLSLRAIVQVPNWSSWEALFGPLSDLDGYQQAEFCVYPRSPWVIASATGWGSSFHASKDKWHGPIYWITLMPLIRGTLVPMSKQHLTPLTWQSPMGWINNQGFAMLREPLLLPPSRSSCPQMTGPGWSCMWMHWMHYHQAGCLEPRANTKGGALGR